MSVAGMSGVGCLVNSSLAYPRSTRAWDGGGQFEEGVVKLASSKMTCVDVLICLVVVSMYMMFLDVAVKPRNLPMVV